MQIQTNWQLLHHSQPVSWGQLMQIQTNWQLLHHSQQVSWEDQHSSHLITNTEHLHHFLREFWAGWRTRMPQLHHRERRAAPAAAREEDQRAWSWTRRPRRCGDLRT